MIFKIGHLYRYEFDEQMFVFEVIEIKQHRIAQPVRGRIIFIGKAPEIVQLGDIRTMAQGKQHTNITKIGPKDQHIEYYL